MSEDNQDTVHKPPQEPLLPADPTEAVKEMMKITGRLNTILDQEAMALATKDAVGFSALQEEKNKISVEYQNAAQEFSDRIETFRVVEQSLLDELEALQGELKKKATSSQNIMQGIIDNFKERLIVQKPED